MKNLAGEQSEQGEHINMETLEKAISGILNNTIIEKTSIYGIEWELINGNEEDASDVCQWYIISEDAAKLLKKDAEQVIFYSEYLDMYVWGVAVYGAPWEDIEIIGTIDEDWTLRNW